MYIYVHTHTHIYIYMYAWRYMYIFILHVCSCYSMLQLDHTTGTDVFNILTHTATHNTLQHAAIHCNTLLHTATHLNHTSGVGIQVPTHVQCAAVCCSVLQRVAVCCTWILLPAFGDSKSQHKYIVVQRGAAWCSVVQRGAAWCSVVQRVAACCSVLQRVAVCCTWSIRPALVSSRADTSFSRLKSPVVPLAFCAFISTCVAVSVAMCCSAMQHFASQCVAVCCRKILEI